MNAQMRYVLLILAVIVGLHYLLSISNESYGNATSISNIKGTFSKGQPPYKQPVPEEYYIKANATEAPTRKANAAFVILARNSDLNGIVSSVKQMEDRFNKKFNYPYVFLNDQEFSESFKKRVTKLTDAKVEFGVIPREHWMQPDSIDENKASESRANMVKNGVIYGGSVPYRNMCRFNSGFFYRHELLKPYKYYWRVEPDVTFFCDLDYDPFLIMQDQNKVYEFTSQNPELVAEGNAMSFLSDDGGESYNRCHFWSNFEIADLDLWRGEAYSKFFEFLEEKGGFYYERWGDAPVHSIGAALFAKKEQIVSPPTLGSLGQGIETLSQHFFNDIGYRHNPFQHCPQKEAHTRGKCWCEESDNFDYEGYSCLKKYDALFA